MTSRAPKVCERIPIPASNGSCNRPSNGAPSRSTSRPVASRRSCCHPSIVDWMRGRSIARLLSCGSSSEIPCQITTPKTTTPPSATSAVAIPRRIGMRETMELIAIATIAPMKAMSTTRETASKKRKMRARPKASATAA